MQPEIRIATSQALKIALVHQSLSLTEGGGQGTYKINPSHNIMLFVQTYQVSRIGRESHAFECYLTLTRLPSSILCKSHAFQPEELEMGVVCRFTHAQFTF